MLQFGLRAHDFGRHTAENLAETLAPLMPASIQLALSKALADLTGKPGTLNPGAARKIRDTLAKRGIAVSILGCYINPVHPDPDARESALRRFEEHLRYARDFGCSVVGTETGSLNPDCSWHPDTAGDAAFERLTESVARLCRVAEGCGAIVGIEPVAYQHTVSSVERMAELIRRVDSPALGVIWDPVNLIPPEGPDFGIADGQDLFFRKALDAFGDRIVAVHLKDFRIEGGKKNWPFPAGTGDLDIETLFRLLSDRKPMIDVLLENADPETAGETLALLRRMDAGLT